MYESIVCVIFMYAHDMHITFEGRKLKANHPTILIIYIHIPKQMKQIYSIVKISYTYF